ncbi:putative transmembrane amino acid transporter protein [Lyophyllum shimeji]|uniref:Transmembrane amino acid transporter protein n=1 Tax=Lyophyllum shimeji TaxID=47721 RepID=A0A9P3UQM9_LYOSH|nr:putative transmembrane amino acid transporter protein [Lyophyllum shimeji]
MRGNHVFHRLRGPNLRRGAWARANLAQFFSSLFSPNTARTTQYTAVVNEDEEDEAFEMVQAYGAVPSKHSEPGERDGGENSALLSDDRDGMAEQVEELPDGHATILSCISNLANTIMGTGMLTFPLAMASAGIIPGIITCIFSGSVAGFGLYLLTLCATQTAHRRASFFAVSELTFPKAAVFFDAAIAIKCFGVSISYLIIVKGLMPKVVRSFYHVIISESREPPQWTLSGAVWLTMFMIFLIPLAYLRRIDSLRHSSYVALFSVAYLVVIVIYNYFWPLPGTPERGEVHLVHFSPTFVSTFPIQVFAFTCAQNIFPLYNEVKTNSQKRMNIIIGSSIGSATLVYEIIGLFGYLTFGSNVGANIIAMYPSTSVFIACGQLAIVVLVLFSYPLQVHPCRNCLDKVFTRGQKSKPAAVKAHDDEPENEEEDEEPADEDGQAEMTTFKHTMITSGIVAGSFTIAYLVDDLQKVLSFVGSTGSTTISFILPGLLYWKLTRDDPSKSRALNWAALVLAIYGGFIFVFSLGFNIYQVVHDKMGPGEV